MHSEERKTIMKNKFLFLKLFLTSLIVFFSTLSYSDDNKIIVVSTIYPVSDWVRNIGKEKISSLTLLPPNASPHTYEPTPIDIKQVSNAVLFVKVGLGLELWSDKLILASGNRNLKILTLSDGLEILEIKKSDWIQQKNNPELQNKTESQDIGYNPHFWLDPITAIKCVEKITDKLCSLDLQNKEYYQKNANEYKDKLLALDKKAHQELDNIKNKNYISFHNAFTYFAKRYNLTEVAVIEEFPGKEPSPQYMKQLVNIIRQKNVKAIFAEPQFSDKFATILAKETGINVSILDPIGTPYVKVRADYLSLMEYNIQVIKEALK